jgi:hypothetical protein
MDSARFDALAKSLVASASRRRLLSGLAAGLLGMAGGQGADARVCGMPGNICREHADCCSGLCGARDLTRRRRCQCKSAADCPVADGGCQTACDAGVCAQPTNPYGASACETPATFCAEGMPTCGGDPNCWAMPATSGCCACSSAPGRSHQSCTTDTDCAVLAQCGRILSGKCDGDFYISCTTDTDCASLASCQDGACGGQICTTDADCEAALGPGTVCISGEALPCTAGGSNICWTLCTGT